MKKAFFLIAFLVLTGTLTIVHAKASIMTNPLEQANRAEMKAFVAKIDHIVRTAQVANFERWTGLLKNSGSINFEQAIDILYAFIRFSNKIEEGEKVDDISFLTKYIRTDIEGFPLDKIREVILERVAMALGKESVTDEEAYDFADALKPQTIDHEFWGDTGYESVRFDLDGATPSTWVPTRSSETLLFYEDEPVFALYCFNPIIIPKGNIVQEQPKPKKRRGQPEFEETTKVVQGKRDTGGINNSSNATNTVHTTVYNEVTVPAQESQPQVIYQQKEESGVGKFLTGLAIGVGGALLLNRNRDVRTPSYGRDDNYRSNSRGYTSNRNRSSRRVSGSRDEVRRYNTSSPSSRIPTNYGGSTVRRSNNDRTYASSRSSRTSSRSTREYDKRPLNR